MNLSEKSQKRKIKKNSINFFFQNQSRPGAEKGFLLKYSGLGFVAWGLGALTWTSSLILHFWCLPKELIMFSDRSHSTGAGFNGYKFRAMLWGCFV